MNKSFGPNTHTSSCPFLYMKRRKRIKKEEFSPSNRKSPLFTVPLDIREQKFCMSQRKRKQIFSGVSRTNASVFVA